VLDPAPLPRSTSLGRRLARIPAFAALVLGSSGLLLLTTSQVAGATTETFSSAQTGTSGETQAFSQSAGWQMSWSYNCASYGGSGNFIVTVDQPSGDNTIDFGPNELGTGGSGTDYYTDTGTFSLSVNSECEWTINVSPSNVAPATGTADYSSAHTGDSGDTSQFTESGSWQIAWSYNCAGFTGGAFDVFIDQPPGDTAVDTGPSSSGAGASGTTYYSDTGTFSLSVDSDCAWTITVSPQTSPAPNPPPATCNANDHIARSSEAKRAIPTSGLGYTSLSAPIRIADTRSGATDPATYASDTLCPGGSLTVDMPSGVATNAGAVVAQLTAVSPSQGGYLACYPAGGSIPATANVVFAAGQIVGNIVTVGLGTDPSDGDPAISIYNGPSGDTDFTLDLYGYYAPQSTASGAAYVPVTPTRLADTRPGSGYTGAGHTLDSQADTLDLVVAGGSTGVPASVTAVVVNIAVVDATSQSYLQSYPTGSPPSSSTPTVDENWLPGEVLSTKAVVGIGSGGSITLSNAQGSTDVVVDLDGYFTAAGAPGDLFATLASPARLADTRAASQVPAGASLAVSVAGYGGIPANAAAAVLNVTDIAGGPNYLTVYPGGQSVPTAADVNYSSGDVSSTVGNASYGTVGTSGTMGVFDSTSPANVVVDAFGYFSS